MILRPRQYTKKNITTIHLQEDGRQITTTKLTPHQDVVVDAGCKQKTVIV